MAKQQHKFLNPNNVVRIIGGDFGGRKLKYAGDPATRPMKDRTREAVFNLIGTELRDKHVIDLFAGTGAMAIEAISRGANSATIIERHFPMARALKENLELLDLTERCELVTGDVFAWMKRRPVFPPLQRVVFCCPPYALYEDRKADVVELLNALIEAAPSSSLCVAEFDERFSPHDLPGPDEWDVRRYAPASIAIRRL